MIARTCSLLSLFAALSPTSSPTKLQSGGASTMENVVVFDNVLPAQACDNLHQSASKIGLGHRAFTRPLKNADARSTLELTLDRILTELGDEPPSGQEQYVEYWTRQEWRHIEAHADVDENLAKEQDTQQTQDSPGFRYPTNGHVLYLKIGSQVRGPTCVFPSHSSGGDLYSHVQSSGDAEVDLVTVPANDGRLLRFDGTALHAVPRPTDIWFLSFVKGAPQYAPEEEWGRSVILFNTWTGKPPLAVPLDEDWEDSNTDQPMQVHGFLDWEKVFDLAEEESCTSVEDGNGARRAKVWLLGNERRRAYPMRTIALSGTEQVREALLRPDMVSRVKLRGYS